MNVAGIDLSSFHVDVVKIPLDGDGAEWHRFPLTGKDAFDRSRSVADAMPGRASVFWDDVLAVGIEEPRGHGAGSIYRVQGAILGRIPPATLVHPLVPSSWRKLVGLKGNASKAAVYAWTAAQHRPSWLYIHDVRGGYGGASSATGLTWPQDACDAYCIALATRKLLQTSNPQVEVENPQAELEAA